MVTGFYNILSTLSNNFGIYLQEEEANPMQVFYSTFSNVLEETGTELLVEVDGKKEKIPVCVASFLYGFCVNLALRMHKEYGYDVEIVMNEEEFAHMYCVTEINGVKHYIDSRGITDDYDAFINFFTYGENNSILTYCLNSKEAQEIINSGYYPDDAISKAMCDWYLNAFASLIDSNNNS